MLKVSACLVTRGDQPEQVARIIGTLPYDECIVWDNSQARDLKTAGRIPGDADEQNTTSSTFRTTTRCSGITPN